MNYIYAVTNLINGKKYVGRTSNPEARFARHKLDARNGSDLVFHMAIRKYGEDSFEMEIIDKCESVEEAIELEKKFISELKTHIHESSGGYNMTSGGDGFSSEETSFYLNKRTSEGRNPFQVGNAGYEKSRERQRQLVETGNHIFQQDHMRDKVSKRQKEMVKSGKHPLMGEHGSRQSSAVQQKRLADGSFHMHQPEMQEHMRQKALKEIAEGTHNFVRVSICPWCSKEGKGPMMKRWHFDNCKMKKAPEGAFEVSDK